MVHNCTSSYRPTPCRTLLQITDTYITALNIASAMLATPHFNSIFTSWGSDIYASLWTFGCITRCIISEEEVQCVKATYLMQNIVVLKLRTLQERHKLVYSQVRTRINYSEVHALHQHSHVVNVCFTTNRSVFAVTAHLDYSAVRASSSTSVRIM